MLINTAIVEDDADQSGLLKEYLESIEKDTVKFSISVFPSAEEFLSSFSSGQFQLLFLDIQLKKIDGLSAARRVRKVDEDAVIVFITSMSQFAISGYEVDARDYILKPLIYDTFVRKMERILPFVKEKPNALIRIPSYGDKPDLIQADELVFVEVFGHRLVYHCLKGDFEAAGKISDAETALKPNGFIRCNRNTVLNPKYIERVQDNLVKIGGYELTISAPRKKEFMRELNSWIR